MNKNKVFSVSIVFSLRNEQEIKNTLRSIILYAKSEDEALGTGIRLMQTTDLVNYSISLKCVVEINESFLNKENHE